MKSPRISASEAFVKTAFAVAASIERVLPAVCVVNVYLAKDSYSFSWPVPPPFLISISLALINSGVIAPSLTYFCNWPLTTTSAPATILAAVSASVVSLKTVKRLVSVAASPIVKLILPYLVLYSLVIATTTPLTA